MQGKLTPREKRRSAGKSQIEVAVAAGVSIPTLRLYEADRAAVSEGTRALLDTTYATLRPAGRR